MVASLIILIRLLLQERGCQDQLRFSFWYETVTKEFRRSYSQAEAGLSRDLVPIIIADLKTNKPRATPSLICLFGIGLRACST